jgi:hypothetical protein
MLGQPADGRRVRPAVVVHHYDDLVLGRGDVVERLPAHPAGQRAVADHCDHVPVLAAQRERLGQPVGVRQSGGRVRVLDEVVLALRLVRVAGQTAGLTQQVEALLPAGDHLVHVRLVPGVEQDPVARRVEDPVQRERHLHDAEVGPEVAAGAGHLGDQEVADLRRQDRQLVGAEPLEIRGRTDRAEQTRGTGEGVAHVGRV